jgi:Putative MetA-pathway of phenol degradation
MSRNQLRWAAALGLAMILPAATVHAEDPWWAVKRRPAAPTAAPGRSAPLATLGRPVAAPETGWNTPTADLGVSFAATAPHAVLPAGYDETPGGLLPPRVARGQPPDPGPPAGALSGPPPGPPPADGGYSTGVAVDQPLRHPFFEGIHEWFNFGARPSTNGGDLCKSDCFCGDSMISPVSNPFFFEDPRALTEIKPLFIIQKIPGSAGGGNAEFYGLQGRLALTERFSLVVNKLGFVSLNPRNPPFGFDKGTGFAEVNIGPKFTFWRDEAARNVAAVGLNLELPVGSSKEFQDTGTLGLDPYITYAQTFGDSSFGSFNFMAEAGYSFAVDNQRSQFLHTSLHLDYDIARAHRWYPLVEMNWFHYVSKGNRSDLNFEGGDLVNFGSRDLNGRNLLTIAPGFRYKFAEWAQVGTAVEFPLTSHKGLEDMRWTVDLIFRY